MVSVVGNRVTRDQILDEAVYILLIPLRKVCSYLPFSYVLV